MSFMDAMVPDVATMCGEAHCVRDAGFPEGTYTGQHGTHAGRLVRHGYGRMDFENGDWYQGEWATDEMHGKGCFYYKKQDFGYQGAFESNCAVNGTYFFGNLVNFQHNVCPKGTVHVLRERSWEVVNLLQNRFWESLYKL